MREARDGSGHDAPIIAASHEARGLKTEALTADIEDIGRLPPPTEVQWYDGRPS